ncbi:MAG: ABC transporter permease subunit, partial [Promethearchaeota archaeon]
SEAMAYVIGTITIITISITLLITGMYLMRWYAKKKRWDDSLKIAFIINIILSILNIPLNLLFYFIYGNNSITFIIGLVINIVIGSLLVMYFYKKRFTDSFLFVLVIHIILFFLTIIFSLIIGFIIPLLTISIIYPQTTLNTISIIWDIFTTIFMNGLAMTLLLTVLGLLGGFVLGLSLALMRVYGSKELAWFSSGYEKLFRGIPILILIFIFAFGMPGLFWFIAHPLDRVLASVILALALRSGAYQSQIFRGAILSVDLGQMEAGRALGMSQMKAFRHIILPQALRLSVPSWSNEYAVVIKDTSFAFEVGVIEMTRWAYRWGANFPELWILSLAILAVTYFLFTFPVTKFLGERQSKKLKKLGLSGG